MTPRTAADTLVPRFKARIEALSVRIQSLTSLRRVVGLPPPADLSESRWVLLNAPLVNLERRLSARLDDAANRYLSRANSHPHAQRFNSLLGQLELKLSKTFDLFDTYVDVLTQRHSPELGPLLRGCDALAAATLLRDHPALTAAGPPLVYCDRGFGASVLRTGVMLAQSVPNLTPLIQIPYARLQDKLHLSSVVHEVGHEALVLVELRATLSEALRCALRRARAPEEIQNLYGLWSSELGPDFWAFCASGIAQPAGLREVLALPPAQVLRISFVDPHPAPFIRVLASFDWCRQCWGRGPWERWEDEWLALYPLALAPPWCRNLLAVARTFIPLVTRTLLRTRFRALGRRTLPALFNLAALSPRSLARYARKPQSPEFARLDPGVQLAVFRWIRENGRTDTQALDKLMTEWLGRLRARPQPTNAQQTRPTPLEPAGVAAER